MREHVKKLLESAVWVNPERMGGQPCFRDTRVTVKTLFDNLSGGTTLEDFYFEYEGVRPEQVEAVFDAAQLLVDEFALKELEREGEEG